MGCFAVFVCEFSFQTFSIGSGQLPDAESRKTIISALLQPKLDIEGVNKFSRAGLFRLFDPKSYLADNVIPSNISYEAFVRYTSAWKGPESYVFFSDESIRIMAMDDADPADTRIHEGGLCYMHAPVVLQSYLISWKFWDAEQRWACEMLDMTSNIKENFSPRELRYHIVDDKGGCSIVYLNSILERWTLGPKSILLLQIESALPS